MIDLKPAKTCPTCQNSAKSNKNGNCKVTDASTQLQSTRSTRIPSFFLSVIKLHDKKQGLLSYKGHTYSTRAVDKVISSWTNISANWYFSPLHMYLTCRCYKDNLLWTQMMKFNLIKIPSWHALLVIYAIAPGRRQTFSFKFKLPRSVRGCHIVCARHALQDRGEKMICNHLS